MLFVNSMQPFIFFVLSSDNSFTFAKITVHVMDKESHHICNLRRGDIASFEYLYNVWSGKLYNFVMRISRGDTYLTEEIVQSVFIKVWEGRELIDTDKSSISIECWNTFIRKK